MKGSVCSDVLFFLRPIAASSLSPVSFAMSTIGKNAQVTPSTLFH